MSKNVTKFKSYDVVTARKVYHTLPGSNEIVHLEPGVFVCLATRISNSSPNVEERFFYAGVTTKAGGVVGPWATINLSENEVEVRETVRYAIESKKQMTVLQYKKERNNGS